MRTHVKENILAHNDPQFFVDLKKATRVLVYANETNYPIETDKENILFAAESQKIKYHMTNNGVGEFLFVVE